MYMHQCVSLSGILACVCLCICVCARPRCKTCTCLLLQRGAQERSSTLDLVAQIRVSSCTVAQIRQERVAPVV